MKSRFKRRQRNGTQEPNVKTNKITNLQKLGKKTETVEGKAGVFLDQTSAILEAEKAKSAKPMFSLRKSWFKKRNGAQELNAQDNSETFAVLAAQNTQETKQSEKTQQQGKTSVGSDTRAKVQARGTKLEATAQSTGKSKELAKEFANLAREASKRSNNKPFFTALGALVFGGLGAAVAYIGSAVANIHKYNWNVLWGAGIGAVIGALFGFGLGCYTEKSKLPSESIAGAGDPKPVGFEGGSLSSGQGHTPRSLSQ